MSGAVRAMAWAGGLALWWVAISAWRLPAHEPAQHAGIITLPQPAPLREFSTQEVTLLRARNPFRATRQEALLRHGEPVVAQVDYVGPVSLPPTAGMLRLAGIIGGPPWRVVIEGVGGHEMGVVLGIGDEVAGVTLRRLYGDTAVVSTADTTVVLTMGGPGR